MRRALLLFVPLAVAASLAAIVGRGRAARVAVGPGSDTTVYVADVTIAPGQTGDNRVLCPGGWRAVSGGVGATTSPAPAHQIQASWPVGDDGVSPAQDG